MKKRSKSNQMGGAPAGPRGKAKELFSMFTELYLCGYCNHPQCMWSCKNAAGASVGDMATCLLFSRSGLGQALERRRRALRLRTPVQIARGGQQLPGYRFLRQRHPLSVREICSSSAENGAISQKAPSLNGSPRLPSEGGVLPFGYILMSVVRRF